MKDLMRPAVAVTGDTQVYMFATTLQKLYERLVGLMGGCYDALALDAIRQRSKHGPFCAMLARHCVWQASCRADEPLLRPSVFFVRACRTQSHSTCVAEVESPPGACPTNVAMCRSAHG